MSVWLEIIDLVNLDRFSICDVTKNDDGSISIVLSKTVAESEILETETFVIEQSNPDYDIINLLAVFWR